MQRSPLKPAVGHAARIRHAAIPATLIYNPTAPRVKAILPEELVERFSAVAIDLRHHRTDHESEVAAGLPDDSQPIVAVGGDGTIRGVIRALLGRSNPLIILPGGSANNIARSLGLADQSIADMIARLDAPLHRRIDLGRIHFPWGQSRLFVEGAGFGLFADALDTYDIEKGKSIPRGLQTMIQNLAEQANYHTTIAIDGRNYEGDYKLVEILNTASVGPGLNLVPDASMTDGLLRVILVESSVAAAPALLALLAGRLGSLEGVDTQTGKRIAVDWDGFRLHVDRYIYPRKADRPSLEMAESKNNPIQVEILRKAITIWFPRRGDDH